MSSQKSFLLLLAVLVYNFCFSQIPPYVPVNGLIGWYPFNGNANDESGNNNNGTVNGPALTTDRFGQTNKAYQFNQGNNLICTVNTFNSPNSISYSVWFKTNSPVYGQLIGFNNGQCSHGGTWDRTLWIEPAKVVFYTFNGSEIKHSYNVSLMDNNWHHCVTTMDGSGSKIYIDGALVSSNSSQNVGQTNTGYFRIGGLSPNDINNSLIGSYDDIGIWNRALTQSEVTLLYQNTTLDYNFSSFSINVLNGKSQIEWSVEDPNRITNFEIQKSISNSNFKTIDKILSSNEKKYSWSDLNATAGNNYYRLKVNEKNGLFFYSNILRSNVLNTETKIIFQNPVRGRKLQFSTSIKGFNLILITMDGRILNTYKISEANVFNNITLPNNIASGLYILKVESLFGNYSNCYKILVE